MTRDEHGATATEYALLISGIAAVLVVIIFAFGDSVTGLFDDTCREVAAQTTADC